MNALALGVLTSVVAALAIGAVVRVVGLWDRLRLWRLARGRRRGVARRLSADLALSPTRRRRLSRRQVELLAGSFRLQLRSRLESADWSEKVLDARALLEHVAQHGERVHLVNAESGYGKSVLGMTLSCLPTSNGLTPLYVDLADADGDEPLVEIEEMLSRLGSDRDRGLLGRPLIVIDALNETVDPAFFCARLANREAELRRLGAKLLFLFSFRHPSYPARLRAALLAHGFGPPRQIRLLFDPGDDRDLAFFPELARAEGRTRPAAGEITGELRAYADRHAPGPLSRGDLRAFMEWRQGQGDGAGDATLAPSPASLRFAALIRAGVRPSSALDRLAGVAFNLLSREVTAVAYAEIGGGSGREALRGWVRESGLDGRVRCGDSHLRFDNETTVRGLGAVWIARLLSAGESPGMLRGRTTYDVCAPYLQPALRWTLDRDGVDAGAALTRVSDSITDALRGRDAPYSFYATALCGERSGLFGDQRGRLDATLFGQMIVAIDDDRAQTWRGSLEAAGRSEPQPTLDPVLDQLFEVMTAYSSQAVELLLGAMGDPEPLVRSQAAYLLLDWVNSVSTPAAERDRTTLEAIPFRMSGDDGNLHFRFHQVEVLEALLSRCPKQSEVSAEAISRLLEIAAARPGTVGEAADVYAECQRLVAQRAAHLARPSAPGDFGQDLGDSVRRCMESIAGDQRFLELGSGPGLEARLECWEVTLAFAVYSCRHLHRNAEFTSFVEAALAHPFWIVRWWAFAGLIGLISAAGEVEDRVLAARCARTAVRQLCAGVEPMGLKHRQCALVARLLDGEDEEAAQAMRTALNRAAEHHLTAAGQQELGESYYEVMGASPDAYLAEFFRRLGELVPSPD